MAKEPIKDTQEGLDQENIKVESDKTDLDEGMDAEELMACIKEDIEDACKTVEEKYKENWDYLNNLYHNVRDKDIYQEEWQSNLALSQAFGPVNQEVPMIMGGLFPRPDFYALEAVDDDGSPKYRKTVAAHRAIMEVQAEQMHLYKHIYWTVLDALIFSAGFCKIEWDFQKRQKKYLDYRSGNIVKVKKTEVIARPKITNISPYDVAIDPDATGIEDARFVVEKCSVPAGAIADSKAYNMIDDKNKLIAEIKETVGKKWRSCRVDLYFYYTPTEIIAVTQNFKYMLKKHTTPYKHNRIPFFNLVKFPEARTPMGTSTVEAIADMVEYTTMLANTNADNIRIALNKLFLLKSSSDVDQEALKVGPGRILKVRQNDELTEFPMRPISPMIYREYQQIDAWINQAIGNLDAIDASNAKTATEAKIMASRASQKVKEFIVYNREEFLKPLLKTWIDLNQQYLKTQDDIVRILGKKKLKDLELEGDDVDLNVDMLVRISGDAGLLSRTEQLEALTQFTQLVAATQQLPQEIDKTKYIETLVELMPAIPKSILAKAVPAQPTVAGPGTQGTPAPQESVATGVPVPPAASPQDQKAAIGQEIEVAAKQANMAPEQLISALASKLGMDPVQVIDEIVKAGSLAKFLQNISQRMQGGNV